MSVYDCKIVNTHFISITGRKMEKPNLTDELVRLAELRDKGILTEEEFQQQKQRLLAQNSQQESAEPDLPPPPP
ncbi:SHOCT domain-containing protein, partial [Bergeriella denitrificans]|uniref:SHOCT domain-containing protein n=1 Tax=Bergeriella denitrificans TaxID=494 RepID=UPI001470488B